MDRGSRKWLCILAGGLLAVVMHTTAYAAQAEMLQVAAMNVPGSILLLEGGSAPMADDAVIGSVKKVSSPAFVFRDEERLTADKGMLLYRADVLSTGPDGAIGILMRDSTAISVGGESELALESFEYDPARGNLSFVARLFKGVMAYLSGGIAKLQPDAVNVHTPHAVIGIRGTHFAVKVED